MEKEFWIFMTSSLIGVGIAMRLMWEALKRDHDRLERRADKHEVEVEKCERDRAALRSEVGNLRATVQRYVACSLSECPAKK